jgi:hypothetical protein
VSDSQTKIIPAKRLEELRAESRRLEDLRAESLEVDVDVVFDENEEGTGGAASRRGQALDPMEALEGLEASPDDLEGEEEPSLGATAARVFDPAALDAAVAGAATTRRVWAVTVPTRSVAVPAAQEDEVESLDDYEEVGDQAEDDDAEAVADDGWDDSLDSVPLQLSSKRGQTSPPMAAAAPSSNTGSLARPMLRTSGFPPKKV